MWKNKPSRVDLVECSVHPVARYRAEDSTHALQWSYPHTLIVNTNKNQQTLLFSGVTAAFSHRKAFNYHWHFGRINIGMGELSIWQKYFLRLKYFSLIRPELILLRPLPCLRGQILRWWFFNFLLGQFYVPSTCETIEEGLENEYAIFTLQRGLTLSIFSFNNPLRSLLEECCLIIWYVEVNTTECSVATAVPASSNAPSDAALFTPVCVSCVDYGGDRV